MALEKKFFEFDEYQLAKYNTKPKVKIHDIDNQTLSLILKTRNIMFMGNTVIDIHIVLERNRTINFYLRGKMEKNTSKYMNSHLLHRIIDSFPLIVK